MKSLFPRTEGRLRSYLIAGVAIAVLMMAIKALAASPSLASVRKLYIAPMPGDLNVYLTASIMKRLHGRLTIVEKKDEGDATLKGSSSRNSSLSAALTGGSATAAVEMVGKDGSIMWSDSEAGHSFWYPSSARAERNSADRIAKALAKAFRNAK